MMHKIYFSSLLVFFLSACSQEESQPYVEENKSLSSSHEQGYIETH